jgi:myo-inositol-hexaphosphate 3-phosphohydrolase
MLHDTAKIWQKWLIFGGALCAMLNALGQPVIVSQPAPQAVPVDGATTFWVKATGTGPLSFQWFFNSLGNPIPGATNAAFVIDQANTTNAGSYRVRVTNAQGSTFSGTARLTVFARSLPTFGTITLPPAFDVNGAGSDVDSIAFWEAPEPTNMLMFVTGKANDTLEVWKYPFAGNELPARLFPANINGVEVDQETDRLYVTDSRVSVFSLPALQLQTEFGQGIIGVGENNIDILKHTNGQSWVYVSDDHNVHRFVAGTWAYLGAFAPPVVSIETLVADPLYQMILVPDEQGALGNPGVYAYHPDGSPYLKNGTNRFGNNGEFNSDEEGILLYTFPSDGLSDNGTGFIVVTDQKSDVTDFEFFDRQSWLHLGVLRITGVSNTDGISSTQVGLPAYPLGLFAAIDNDTSTVGLGWDVIFRAIDAAAGPRVLSITPSETGPTSADAIDFTIQFNEPVTNFNDASDLVIAHFGTAHTNATVSGTGATYSVTMSGITGRGFFLVGASTNSGVTDLRTNALLSSLTSVPVFIDTPYGVWAATKGLVRGVNDGFADDPDEDGCLNIKEFAIDGDPLHAASDGKQRMRIESRNATNYFTYTFPVRDGAEFQPNSELTATVDGLVYSLAGSPDLINFADPIVEEPSPSSAGLPMPNPGWAYRTFRLDLPISNHGFIRLLVTESP